MRMKVDACNSSAGSQAVAPARMVRLWQRLSSDSSTLRSDLFSSVSKQSTPSPPPPPWRTTSPPNQAQQASILHFLNLSRSRRLKRTTIGRPKNGFLLSLKGRRRHVARRLSKRRGTGGSVEKRSERSRRGWRRVGLRRWLLRVLTGKRSAGRREIPVTIVT